MAQNAKAEGRFQQCLKFMIFGLQDLSFFFNLKAAIVVLFIGTFFLFYYFKVECIFSREAERFLFGKYLKNSFSLEVPGWLSWLNICLQFRA